LLLSSASGPYSWAVSNAEEDCSEHIACYVPDYLSIVEEYPAAPSGKIQ